MLPLEERGRKADRALFEEPWCQNKWESLRSDGFSSKNSLCLLQLTWVRVGICLLSLAAQVENTEYTEAHICAFGGCYPYGFYIPGGNRSSSFKAHSLEMMSCTEADLLPL